VKKHLQGCWFESAIIPSTELSWHHYEMRLLNNETAFSAPKLQPAAPNSIHGYWPWTFPHLCAEVCCNMLTQCWVRRLCVRTCFCCSSEKWLTQKSNVLTSMAKKVFRRKRRCGKWWMTWSSSNHENWRECGQSGDPGKKWSLSEYQNDSRRI
jgi:hypothetical protein